MAVNLSKHKEALIAAWKDVLDDKTPTNWALFGYEGHSNDLKFVSKGSSGIEELVEDLNSGKVMFAFLQVTDPKTSLPKNVFINWQGEGAPNVRKATCANHVRDVAAFFKGAHVTINARTEEEVDPTLIIDKVSKSTGSVYKFNERTETVNDSGPVGTAYKRTIPKQEINSIERDKFWEQQEAEEKLRQQSERSRKEEERKKLEVERTQRDSQETAMREAKILETTKSINQIRLAEKAHYDRTQAASNQPIEDLEKEELERRNRADILRRQRSEEAQSLIAKRTIDARGFFEQNTSSGQMTQRRSSVQPRLGGEPAVAAQRLNIEVHANEDWKKNEEVPKVETIVDSAKVEPVIKHQSQLTAKVEPILEVNKVATNGMNGNAKNIIVEDEHQDWEDDVRHEITATVAITQPPAAFEDKDLLPSDQFYNGDLGQSAKALYDYQAADETEITFDPGDIITHIDQVDEGWWQGLGPDGTFGLFPANYVELIN